MGFKQISFSEAQGYEEIPKPLKLGELPKEARTSIWNLVYFYVQESSVFSPYTSGPVIGDPWNEILQSLHVGFDCQPLDEWGSGIGDFRRNIRSRIESQPFNKVFDLIQFVLRHPRCPSRFVKDMRCTFEEIRLAYALDFGPPPTIVPAATTEEGDAVVASLQSLQQAGLIGSAKHLQEASAQINNGDWAGSVRESIHAVESVARQLYANGERTLGSALTAIERHGALHPALKQAFIKLYAYTCDEQGIRHALVDQTDPTVGMDEAVFMLGACASFASYLSRKRVAGAQS